MHLSSINGELCVVNKPTTRSPVYIIKSIKRVVEQITILKRYSIGRDMSVQFSRGDFMKHRISDAFYFKLI
jgi:hypothetical protein